MTNNKQIDKYGWHYIFALLVFCGLLFLLIIFLLGKQPELNSDVPSAAADATPLANTLPVAALDSKLADDDFNEIPSLAGTTIDAQIQFDAAGNLLLSPALLRIYDYFLLGAVDSSQAAMLAKLRAQINRKIHEPARQQALDLLDKYQAYKSREAELAAAAHGSFSWQSDTENMRAAYQQILSLRQQLFGREAAEKLFNDQHMLAFHLAVSELPNSDTLSKINELKALAESLPDEERQAVQRDLKSRELAYYENKLQQEGASAAEFFIMREQLLGTEAAENLQKLDEQRAAWQTRVENFAKAYRHKLQQYQQDNPAAKQLPAAKIAALIKTHKFTELEAKRLRAVLGLY